MKTATATLTGVAPYSQSRFYDTAEVPKINDGKEDGSDYETRTWRSRCHATADGRIFIPAMALKNCLASGAKFLNEKIPGQGQKRYPARFIAGVLVTESLVLPDRVEEVEGEWLLMSAKGIKGNVGGGCVKRCYPVVREWSGQVQYYVLDELITEKIFRRTLEESGKFVGLGRFRPANGGFYGRFTVEALEWD